MKKIFRNIDMYLIANDKIQNIHISKEALKIFKYEFLIPLTNILLENIKISHVTKYILKNFRIDHFSDHFN
jgi:hypothetical protein